MKRTVAELFVESTEVAVKAVKINAADKQVNGVSNREYQGVNQLILLEAKKANKFSSNQWFTQDFLNSKDSEYEIIEGQKGTMVFSNKLFKTGEVKKKKDSEETYEVQEKKLTYYYVFNLGQLKEKA